LELLRAKFLRDTSGQLIFPLAVLTALYFFDEFDSAAFGTLAPDIQRSFHLSDEKFLGLIIINVSLVVLLAVPVGYLADRVRRTNLVVISGVLAGAFSLCTGMAGSVAVLVIARFGNGVGVLANQPIHNSMLSDYYTPDARPGVYANHTNALYVGAIVGPAVAGLTGGLLGWRAAFFVLFVPIIITSIVALRLEEPVRGGTDLPGGSGAEALPPPKFRQAVKTLWGVRTLRRMFWAAIFFGAGLIPLVAYLSLYFEREYHLGALARGLIGAANAAATYVGVQHGGKLTPGWFAKGMGVPVQRIGAVLAAVGVGVLLTGVTPWLWPTIAIGLATNFVLGYFYAPLAAVQALVSPARERSLSFSLAAIFLVIGVALFYLVGLGNIADEHGLRWGLVILSPFWLIGGAIGASAGKFVADDVAKAFAPDPDPGPPPADSDGPVPSGGGTPGAGNGAATAPSTASARSGIPAGPAVQVTGTVPVAETAPVAETVPVAVPVAVPGPDAVRPRRRAPLRADRAGDSDR
jgi:branched-chain amino acid transport system ATP-binding protein